MAKKDQPGLDLDESNAKAAIADGREPPEPEKKKKRTMDPDLHMLARFDRQLGLLDELARTRIMSWLVVKYLPSVTVPKT